MRKNEVVTALFIAEKNVLKNWRALFFTIIVVALGFVSSVFIYGTLEDVGYTLEENFIETNYGHIALRPYGDSLKIEDVDEVIRKVMTVPNVLNAASVNKKSGEFCDSFGDCTASQILVVDEREFSDFSVVDDLVFDGEWLNGGNLRGVVLGCDKIISCAGEMKGIDRIDVDVGEKLSFEFVGGKVEDFYLAGIYDHYFKDVEGFSYITEDAGEDVFGFDASSSDEIVLMLPSRDYVEEVMSEIIELNLGLEVLTWEENSAELTGTVSSFSLIGDLAFLMGIVISFISVLIILYIIILTKETQIGIIKAIGVKSNVVLLSYVFLGFFLGVAGAALGIILTLSLIWIFELHPLITGIGPLVPLVSMKVYFVVGFSIIMASVVSSYIVSRKISKQNIIEAVFNG